MALEKRRPWRPASAQCFTSSHLTAWKRAPPSPSGWWAYLLFSFVGGGGGHHPPWICKSLQKTQEKKVLLAPSSCLWWGWLPPPILPPLQQVCGESAGQCLLMGTVSLLPSSTAKKLMSPTRKIVFFPAANWASSKCHLGSGASFPPAQMLWDRRSRLGH